ncbi:MAG TPA: thymidine phosphorylase [Nannocystaceae bacterium]|nr:thymidine phosphorylase [Nannocystaceae bacterium]
MFPQEIVRKKRENGELEPAEIEAFVRGLVDGSWSEGQVAALAMAVFFRGMTMPERVALTRAMTRSGAVLDWSDAGIDRPIVDKHSSGGVGDKVSLVLAPILAACGAAVPMISGRGLGHTGGTLDKLDAIPGYTSTPDMARFRAVLREVGCAIIGQTADLAPADRRFYAIRDVTATVESIPLITASILSKKLAAGLQFLVMDVKWGSGAFASTLPMARELAASIVGVASGAGLRCTALVTDMNQVLGGTAGNAIEVHESIDVLAGRPAEPRLVEVTLALAAELLHDCGLAKTVADGLAQARGALADGRALAKFAAMVEALGGPIDLVDRPDAYLPLAPVVLDVLPAAPGFLAAIDVRSIGLVVMELGGGRRTASDRIDHGVGLSAFASLGTELGPAHPIARVHARTPEAAHAAADAIRAAVVVTDAAPTPTPTIVDRIRS